MMVRMNVSSPAEASPAPSLRDRDQIAERFKWNLSNIFSDWDAWLAAYADLDRQIAAFAALQGTLAQGSDQLLTALKRRDDIGQLEYKVWYYASLWHDQDQRDNQINAKRQQVQILFAKAAQASAWFDPELLRIPLTTIQEWMAASPALALYRFALEDLYRQQEHVLDDKGEHLLSLSSRFASSPNDAYAALSTADVKYPSVRLSQGVDVTLTYGQYRAILATNRNQADRATAYQEFHKVYEASINTYASLYDAVLQRDLFFSQARGYASTLDAALNGNNIPTAVVENLIAATKAGTDPLRRYHRLRKQVLGLETYHSYDTTIPLVDLDRKYPYEDVLEWLPASVVPLGRDYERQMRSILGGQCIDVYENAGKRSGAYSAPVYGVHPYMLLNYNDTLDSVFTLAHELGHSMHTMLSDAHQPFVYSDYTIFVAEVPSTLSEMLLFDHLLSRTVDQRERIVLLQHAIDDIVGTFYRQCLFADYELQAHRLAEQGEPITADRLSQIYFDLFKTYHGDAMTYDDAARITWARVPHFFGSPYYVYQYATCYASSAQLIQGITTGSADERRAGVERFLELLRAGGSDYPMNLLKRAGVDLSTPEPAEAVVRELDKRVSQLETEIEKLS
jgi:oligoendopeptidase F